MWIASIDSFDCAVLECKIKLAQNSDPELIKILVPTRTVTSSGASLLSINHFIVVQHFIKFHTFLYRSCVIWGAGIVLVLVGVHYFIQFFACSLVYWDFFLYFIDLLFILFFLFLFVGNFFTLFSNEGLIVFRKLSSFSNCNVSNPYLDIFLLISFELLKREYGEKLPQCDYLTVVLWQTTF